MQRSRVIMFSGKGGVGKTTCAAATALHYAVSGEKTLVISTDATPSLAHVFAVGSAPGTVPVRENLCLRELGEAEVREMWHGRFGREVYEVFSSLVDIDYDTFGEFMTSVLPGLSDEFMVDYIREMGRRGDYGVIVWDTAPLGQTLALLQTPALLEKHLRLAPRVYSRLRLGASSREPVLSILRRWAGLSAENMAFLREEVRLTLVTIPEALAVAQLDRVFGQLGRYGLGAQDIIINSVVRDEDSAFLRAKAGQQKRYIGEIYRQAGGLPVKEVPLFPEELTGTARLGEVAAVLYR
ncbi:MAG: ArsA family ATPase [Chloroflexota bacterium]